MGKKEKIEHCLPFYNYFEFEMKTTEKLIA